MNKVIKYKIADVCRLVGADEESIFEFVRNEWILPFSAEEYEFDEEDLARARLILELKNNLDVNAEAIPIILHLVDQIHRLHCEIKTHR